MSGVLSTVLGVDLSSAKGGALGRFSILKASFLFLEKVNLGLCTSLHCGGGLLLH